MVMQKLLTLRFTFYVTFLKHLFSQSNYILRPSEFFLSNCCHVCISTIIKERIERENREREKRERERKEREDRERRELRDRDRDRDRRRDDRDRDRDKDRERDHGYVRIFKAPILGE